MKIDGLCHPKTKELAIELGIPLPHAVGILEFLFAFVAKQTPRGDIGRWSNGVIAAESQWTGDPDEFVNALIHAGFVDLHDHHRLLIHDWPDHAPNWVHAKLKRAGQTVIKRDDEATADLSRPLRADYKPSQAKARQAKTTAPSSASSPPATASKTFIELPLNDKSEHPVTETDVARWQALYPAVDVEQQLRNMRGWLESNPDKRKTKSGVKRFITNWLAREQNQGGSGKSPRAGQNGAQPAPQSHREPQQPGHGIIDGKGMKRLADLGHSILGTGPKGAGENDAASSGQVGDADGGGPSTDDEVSL